MDYKYLPSFCLVTDTTNILLPVLVTSFKSSNKKQIFCQTYFKLLSKFKMLLMNYSIDPPNRTVGLILKCIYNNNLIRSKTVSYFNNSICNQVNRVSMESPFAPDLASILKTEQESRIFKKLFDQRYQSCV